MITKMLSLLCKPNMQQLIKYVFVGVLNVSIFYSVYFVMLKLSFPYIIAVTVGTIIGIINSFLWNKHFTFKSNKKAVSEKVKFLAVYLVQYLLNLLVIYLCTNYIGISAEWSGVVAIGSGFLISYIGHKFWSFR